MHYTGGSRQDGVRQGVKDPKRHINTEHEGKSCDKLTDHAHLEGRYIRKDPVDCRTGLGQLWLESRSHSLSFLLAEPDVIKDRREAT